MTELRQLLANISTTVRTYILRAACQTLSAVSPETATRLAAALFRTPHRRDRPRRERLWAETARPCRLSTRAGLLPAWSWGSGPDTVLLVHGWAGRGLQLGALAAPLEARGYRVVTYDAPGHGEAAGGRSSLPELSAVVAEVARQVGPLRAVVAHSLGATGALWAAAKGELHADRFVALAPASNLDTISERFATLTGFSPRVMELMRRRFELELGFRWSDVSPTTLGSGLDRELLVVHDRDDLEVPWTEGDALVAAAPGSRFLVTDGLGHRRLLHDPEVVAAVVDFVDGSAGVGCQPWFQGAGVGEVRSAAAAASVA